MERILIIWFFLLMILTPPLFPGVWDLSQLDSSARITSLGGIDSVANTQFESIFGNPGSLDNSSGLCFGWMNTPLIGDVNYLVSGAKITNLFGFDFGLGLGLQQIRTDGIYQTALDGGGDAYILNNLQYDQTRLCFSLSRQLQAGLALGIGISTERINWGSLGAGNSYGLDLGAEFQPLEGLKIGVVGKNIMGKMTWTNNINESLSTRIKAGSEIKTPYGLLFIEAESTDTGKPDLRIGTIMPIFHFVELRAGFHPAASDVNNNEWFSLGLGINSSFIKLDYAYKHDFNYETNSQHTFSFLLEI